MLCRMYFGKRTICVLCWYSHEVNLTKLLRFPLWWQEFAPTDKSTLWAGNAQTRILFYFFSSFFALGLDGEGIVSLCASSGIDLFSLYVLFSHFRPSDATRGNSFFQISSYARANLRITNEKTKGKFPWGHHVVWNGKTKCTSWKGLLCQGLPLQRDYGYSKRRGKISE